MGELLAHIDHIEVGFNRRKETVMRFISSKRAVPSALRSRVKDHFDHWWVSQAGLHPERLIDNLPTALRCDVMYELCRDFLKGVHVFKGASDEMFRFLSMEFSFEVVHQGEYIVRQGDMGDRMYFMTRGFADIIVERDDTEVIVKVIGPPSFFGEGSLLNMGTRSASVRAHTGCSLLALTHGQLLNCFEAFPDLRDRLQHLAADVEGAAPDVDLKVTDVESSLVADDE